MRFNTVPIKSLAIFIGGFIVQYPAYSESSPKDSEQAVVAPKPADNRAAFRYHPDSRDRQTTDVDSNDMGNVWHDPLSRGYQPEQTHKSLHDYASQLAMQLMDSARHLSGKDLIGVSSFVRLNETLQEPTVMGNQLAEYLIAELQDYGLGVVDFKVADALTVTPFGDLAMRREGQQHARQMNMDHILTGTLVEEPRGVRVNARIVSTDTHRVVASTTLFVPAFIVTALNH